MTLFSEWGTGKTYLVQRFFETKEATGKLQGQKLHFAYVSLFGAESVAEVRQRLCVASLKGSHHPFLKKASFWGRAVPEKASAKGVSVDLSKLGTLAAGYVQDYVTRDLFVCIDDLERAGKLSAQDLFGLVAELTEQRGCKCLLVFNRSKLSDEQTKTLIVNEEKVFDLNVEYQPSVADNLVHGFIDKGDRAFAARAFTTFRNGNIRVMKRAAWVLRTLRENGASELKLWPKVVEHSAVLTILKHSHSAEVPNLADAVKETSELTRLFDKEGTGKIPAEIRSRLDELQFEATPYDPIVIRLLETGSLNKKDLAVAMDEARSKDEQKNIQTEFHSFWNELRSGFVKDPGPFAARLQKFVAESTDKLSRGELAQVCDLLLEIDPSPENKSIVVTRLGPIFIHVPKEVRLDSLNQFPAILDAKIHEVMPYEVKPAERKLADIVAEIAGSDTGWDPKGYPDLLNFSNDEIRDYFLSLTGERVIFYARHVFERIPGDLPPESASALRAKLKAVFDEIAARNPLTRFQIEYFVRPAPRQH